MQKHALFLVQMLRFAAIFAAMALWSSPLEAAPRRPVTVAIFPHVPAMFMDPQGRAQGFLVDMLQEVAGREGWELRFVPGSLQQGLDGLRRGEVDLLPSAAPSQKHVTPMDFGQESAFTVWSILYAHPGAPIHSILDVRDRRIAIMQSGLTSEHFKQLCAQFNLTCSVMEYPTYTDVLTAVSEGRADGGVVSNAFGYAMEGRFEVERTPVMFSPFDLHFAVAKGRNGDLLAAMDAFLREGKQTPGSGYHRSIQRWQGPREKAGLPPWVKQSAMAVLALLALSVLTLLVTRRRVRKATAEIRALNLDLERELAERRRVEEQILHVAAAVSACTGESFLQELVKHLALTTGANVAFIGESDGAHGRMKTLSVFIEGNPADNFECDLAGTPCERPAQGNLCVVPSEVQMAFPNCALLHDLNVQSYVGAPLLDSHGRTIGVLAVMHCSPLVSSTELAALLRIFSSRAAAELERRHSESDRLQLERQMQHAQKLESLGVLAGGIAHDFNNLLTAMLGHMNVAQLKLAPESPAHPHLESLERIIHRAADLTRQMLAYSGKGRFVVRSYDLNQVVQEVTHLLEVSIPKKIALRFHLAPALPPVEADAAQIQQVIMNLVTNAADAIGDVEGTIRLSTEVLHVDRSYLDQVFQGQDLVPGTYVTLEASDTGCGMSPEIQARIFEPFFTTKVAGRGLGLSATMGILKGHRAGMRIYSEPGRGTTFKLLFPATSTRQDEVSTPAFAPALARKATVLLVDDEEMIRDAATAVLESLGLSVMTASNGLEALELVTREGARVDLVLMDLTMPHMDGREAFNAIRRIQPRMPVILSSGYNEQESIQDFMGRGLAAFLQKPYTLRVLEQTVLDVLAKQRVEA